MKMVFGYHKIYKNRLVFSQDVRSPMRRSFPNVVMEGDSWFAYPGRKTNFFKGPSNLFDALISEIPEGANWFDSAIIGATTARIRKEPNYIRYFGARRVNISLLCISAGGNDVFNRLEHMLYDYNKKSEPYIEVESCFNGLLNKTLIEIESYYLDLIKSRNQYIPNTPILGHDYYPPITRKRGFYNGKGGKIGPWVNSVMTLKGYPAKNVMNSDDLRIRLIKYIHQSVSDTIRRILATHENCFFYSPFHRGIKLNSKKYWDDEIHLSPDGNRKVAKDMISFIKNNGLYPKRKLKK